MLTPNEVMMLSNKKIIIILKGIKPINAIKLNYLEDKEYKGLFDNNPILKQSLTKSNYINLHSQTKHNGGLSC